MIIKNISLQNVRNYKSLSLDLLSGINIFLGENAQGKTNILESVYYSALSKSHRTNNDEDLIKKEAAAAEIKINFERFGVANETDICLYRDKKRQIYFNQEKIKVREIIGKINVVLFSPEDLFLIKGSPQGRRRFLNAEISQANPRYFSDLSVYTHLLNQRNSLLKKVREKKSSQEMLDVWDPQLAELAAKIVTKRQSSIEELNKIASLMQKRLSKEKEILKITYEISGENNEKVAENPVLWYNKRLKETREIDILRGSTSIGPHRDDLNFFVNDNELKSYGSQGQQRTGVLALKLAELEFLRQETGEYPVLLLDDVMSELDSNRRLELLEFIRRENIQTLITATETAYFPADFTNDTFIVSNGKIDI